MQIEGETLTGGFGEDCGADGLQVAVLAGQAGGGGRDDGVVLGGEGWRDLDDGWGLMVGHICWCPTAGGALTGGVYIGKRECRDF